MATTTIAPETRLEGRIEGSEDVTVAGYVEGEIALSESLAIANSGFVRGEVEAKRIEIAGAVDGTIRAEGTVVLEGTARVAADIYAAGLVIEDGAQLAGEIEVEGGTSSGQSSRVSTSTRSTSSSTAGRRSSRGGAQTTTSSARTRSGSKGADTATSTRTQPTTTTTTEPLASSEDSGSSEETADNEDDEEEQSASESGSSNEEESGSTDEFASMSKADISDAYTVRELRDELRERDLTVRGKKAALIDRLKDHADSA